MSALRAVLDKLNDIETTISQVGRGAGASPSLALQLSLQSLESRRDMLREELVELSQQEFVDICDYKLIPEHAESYAMSAITGAWHDFQDILSLVFGSVEAEQPRNSAKLSRDVVLKSQLNFGYAYSGSLGVVMTIRNDRLMFVETNLDKSVAAVFDMLTVRSPQKIVEVKQTYGIPVVRKLYQLSKTHSQFGMAADIKWMKNKEVRNSVLAQPPEFSEICRLIEEKSDTTSEHVFLNGNLLAWNVKTRTFVLGFSEGEPISGHWADDFEGKAQRKVPALYAAELTKKTTVKYSEERDVVVWLLHSLAEISSYGG